MARTVESAIRAAVARGHVLHTPSRNAPFTVAEVDSEGIVLLLGAGEWRTRLTWDCLEGIIPFMQSHGGSVEIGGQHTVVGRPGTLDGYLKGCVKRTTAGWVAVVLEEAGLVEIIKTRPAAMRLADVT